MDRLYTIDQAAEIIQVHPATVRRYIREGKLAAFKASGNVRVSDTSVQEFLTQVSPQLTENISHESSQQIFTPHDPIFSLQGCYGSPTLY